jgi:2-dehydro-3-deoxyphosphogluconate aldolase/(4S)-4-hydroxy-2-oxoglutarate aldolase
MRVLEITMDSEDAPRQIKALKGELSSEVLVGAGTVTSLARLESAVDAGAEVIISPVTDEKVIRATVERGLPAVPGALTPSEILRASEFGATIVKLFPVGPLGPGYVRAMRGPLRDIPVMCNGGINPENARSFLEAGAVAVGIGAELFGDAPGIDDVLDTDALERRVSDLLRHLSGEDRKEP